LSEPFLTIAQASATYPVFVGRGLLDAVGTLVPVRGRVFVVTSDMLRAPFGERVARSFAQPAELIVMQEGEGHKTIDNAYAIVTQFLERGARRDSVAVVVGGGMIGDTAGFAASIFLRGIPLVHVPTTLLAQVDSSIGGKVAVNHEKGKNLIGSFYPPIAVVADTGILETLPARERLSGMYEALKGGIIGDPELFAMFEDGAMETDELVRRAIRVKAEIVSADEKETDLRRLLNYGHTIAHGIEAALHYEGMTHGEAVAWGMIGANEIAVRRGILERTEAERIRRTILRYDPSPIPKLDPRAVLAATEHDKKNTGSQRVMVFPRRVGECAVVSDIREEEIAYGIAAVVS
jgi:3-dehydroquinate synthase